MKTFFQIFTLFLIFWAKISFYNSVVCELDIKNLVNDGAPEDADGFWGWVFGEDDNSTDKQNKPLEHIKEEMAYHYGTDFGLSDKSANLEQEIDFHVFNFHDFDRNKLLDGLEMLKMLDRHEDRGHKHKNAHSFDYNTAVIDMILRTDDTNNDGFLDYNEFKSAKRKHNLKVSHN